nr:NADH dehydrogenase subunit 4 [Borysthenes sp. 1 WQW-2023a]
MLGFIFFLFSLTLFCLMDYWCMVVYLLLVFFFFFFFFFFFSYFGFFDFFTFISCGFGLDSFSYGFIILSFWICCLMIYSMIFYCGLVCSNLLLLNFLLILFFLVLCFLSLDSFSFYFFFESSVLPVFFLILGWGYQPERLNSGLFLIYYTLFSSLPLLLVIFFYFNCFGFFFFHFFFSVSSSLSGFFFIFGFLVSFPMFFFHLWLPSAHVEAPVSGSMILAGVMLSLGGFGLIRFMGFIELFLVNFGFVFVVLSLMGSFYISMFCLVQGDLKVLVAYSSVSHMGLVICGLLILSSWGSLGSFMLMISHGLVSSGLFYYVGCLYDRFGTRSVFILSGLLSFMPSMSLFFFFLCLLNMSCPPSLGLLSEIFIVSVLFSWCFLVGFYVFFILFFTACYSILLFSLTHHGLSSSLVYFVDNGFVREYYVFFLHLFPYVLMVFNVSFFF